MTPLRHRLVESGVLSEEELNRAVLLATERGGTIPLNILRCNLLTENELLELIIKEFDIPAVLQFEMEDIPANVIESIPRRLVETYRAIPVNKAGGTIEVIFSDPTDKRAVREVASASHRNVSPRIATESVISWALLRYYEVITPTYSPSEDRKTTKEEEMEADDELPEDGGRLSFAVIKEEVEEEPGLGDWDEPFELSRSLDEEEEKEKPPVPERVMKTTRREIPLEDMIEEGEKPEPGPEPDEGPSPEPDEGPSPEPDEGPSPEPDEGPDEEPEQEPGPEEPEDEVLLLVDEDDWEETGAALEDAIEEDAVTWEGPILEDAPVKKGPIVMTRNVMLGKPSDREIIPPQPMSRRTAVEGIVQHSIQASRGGKPTKPETPEAKEKPPAKKKPGKLDPTAIDRWTRNLDSLGTRDAVLGATLGLMERLFGPAVFLARKGKNLGGWSCSRGFKQSIEGNVQDILLTPHVPREVWHSLERKRGMMGPIAVRAEYHFLEPLVDERPTLLVLPVVIRNIAAGVFVCVLRDVWTHSPELREALEKLGKILSEKLELILKRKKKQGTK
jgi:hypothetical protein